MCRHQRLCDVEVAEQFQVHLRLRVLVCPDGMASVRTTLTSPLRLPHYFCTVKLCGLAERADVILLSAMLLEKGVLAWQGEEGSLHSLVDHAETLEPLIRTCMSDDIGYDVEAVQEILHVGAVVPTVSVPPDILSAGAYQLLTQRMRMRQHGGWIRFGGNDGGGWGFTRNDPLGYPDDGGERAAIQLFNCCRLDVRVSACVVDKPGASDVDSHVAFRQNQYKYELHISARNYTVHRAAYWRNVDCNEAQAAGTARLLPSMAECQLQPSLSEFDGGMQELWSTSCHPPLTPLQRGNLKRGFGLCELYRQRSADHHARYYALVHGLKLPPNAQWATIRRLHDCRWGGYPVFDDTTLAIQETVPIDALLRSWTRLPRHSKQAELYQRLVHCVNRELEEIMRELGGDAMLQHSTCTTAASDIQVYCTGGAQQQQQHHHHHHHHQQQQQLVQKTSPFSSFVTVRSMLN